MIDNPDDLRAEILDLKRRIRELETHAPLNNASISSGPGIALKGEAMGLAIKTTAENAASAASTADSKAGTAQARADSAWNLANGRVTHTEMASAIGGVKAELESAITKIRNVYNAHIDTYHPGGQKMTG